jgi:hypothetical protein
MVEILAIGLFSAQVPKAIKAVYLDVAKSEG